MSDATTPIGAHQRKIVPTNESNTNIHADTQQQSDQQPIDDTVNLSASAASNPTPPTVPVRRKKRRTPYTTHKEFSPPSTRTSQ